ncbi:endoribonuclease L-psp family protein [Bisporella sp. PMI_857]|nr:endoribonuclease L-psp family protein [Bisporella sp. PMI_857]
MSRLQYFSYPGFGEEKYEELWYSQAVRVGDTIQISGQGGWDPTTSKVHSDLNAEIDQAFSNVELALKTAGGKGWEEVYKINIYATEMGEAAMAALVRNLRRWCPRHRPILTAVGVKELGLEGMRVEIEVAAYVKDN